MTWLALTLEIDDAHAEALSDALLEAGVLAVSLEDAEAGSVTERPRYAEPDWETAGSAWRRTRVQVLLESDADCAGVVEAAAHAAGLCAAPAFSSVRLDDQDWVRATQAQFAPIAIGERLWIVPSWHEPPVPGAVVVRVDPGLAFGTGSHPTTRLVLAWLERTLSTLRGTSTRALSPRVLDYGCGSGILAITAAKLGAAAVDAVDVDPRAIEATAENARRNGVDVRALTAEALPPRKYDLVVANILANPLIALESVLAAHVRAGGALALSGILAPQAEDVQAVYAAHFDLAPSAEEQGWVLLSGPRRAANARR